MKKDFLIGAAVAAGIAAFQFAMGFIAGREYGVRETVDKVTEDLNSENSKLMELRNEVQEQKKEEEEKEKEEA